ncbi:MAG TPA: hypothetical protein VMT79_00360 [Candidatus Binatia bacterium]|nr:hypothetical protein [Candidatus Binatia bacterium]
MPLGRTGARYLSPLVAMLVVSLPAIPFAAGSPASADDAEVRRQREAVRDKYDRALQSAEARIAGLYARERGVTAGRAEKMTRDGIAGLRATLGARGQGNRLARMAERAARQPAMLGDLYRAQEHLLDAAGRASGAERRALRDAATALAKNLELVEAHLATAIAAAEAMAERVGQSGVFERARVTEEVAREAGDRLRAKWSLERAAEERERHQRERETSERTRRLP